MTVAEIPPDEQRTAADNAGGSVVRSPSTESSALESRFAEFMAAGLPALKAKKYTPTYYLRMVKQLGAVGAAHELLRDSHSHSSGLTQLWQMGDLTASVEFAVLLPWFSELFTDEELQTARERLVLLDFAVDAELKRASSVPPGWAG
jgi:hypothetical protein